MYRILNPMNHNVSLVRNDKGEEVIVIGKGIAFGKKKGDLIAEDQVEKIFRMKTEESRENFMALLKDVPLDFITVTYEIIDKLSKKYHYPIQEYLYVILTDHIYCSYQALTQGRYKDSNLPDISTTNTQLTSNLQKSMVSMVSVFQSLGHVSFQLVMGRLMTRGLSSIIIYLQNVTNGMLSPL